MGYVVATLCLFAVSVLSLLLFDPVVTAYVYDEPTFQWRFVTLFTHMVSHGGWAHLLGNFLFGAPYMLYLEHRLQSSKKFIRLFFCAGLVALLFQYIFNEMAIIKSSGLIGSSGAIFGLVGAALMGYRGPRAVQLTAKAILIFHIITQGQAAWVSLVWADGVAYAAHFGGILAGVWFSYHHLNRGPSRSQKRRCGQRRSLPKQ